MKKALGAVVVATALLGWAARSSALGGDYAAGHVPRLAVGTAAETEVNRLVASPGFVHGFFVNAEDRLFYAGDTAAFNAFLKQYAETETGIAAHRLTIHAGKGVAKSPWDKGEGKPCDWMLEVGLLSWREGRSAARVETPVVPAVAAPPKYVVEVHLWSEGKVDLAGVKIPKNIEAVREPR